MLRSPPIHWSSRSPRSTRCGPIFLVDLRCRPSHSCVRATRGYMAWTQLHARTPSRSRSGSVVQPQALRRYRARWQERVGGGSEVAAPRAHTQRVCARVPPFRALVPQRRCPIRYEPAVRRPRRRLRAVHQRHARALPRARASPSTRTPPGVAHRPPPPPSPPPPSPPPFSPPTPSPADALSAAVLALAVAALAAAAHAAAALAAAALDILISHRPIMYYDRPIRPFSLLRVGSRYV